MVDFKERNTTVNGINYASLMHQLREAIKEKRRGKLSRGILLLHDNTPVHKAQVGQAAIRECGFTEIDHLTYSPDLTSSDFWLFKNLKKNCEEKSSRTMKGLSRQFSTILATRIRKFILRKRLI